MDYEKLIQEHGTPTYLYDIETLINRVNYLKSKFDDEIHMVYAVKANTFIAKELEQDVERYEICSPGEFRICNNLSIDRKKMVISGVYKDYETIENMISSYDDIGKYTIESVSQYELLKELTRKYERHIHILIRLTSGNQFGVNEEEFLTILKDKNEFIMVDGIEYFSGTQKHSIKKINREVDYLVEFISKLESSLGISLKEVEFGPGLPVFYFQDDEFDEEEFLTEVNLALRKMKGKVISLEIGRSIAASCGTYLTKVVDMKSNKNGNFTLVDGGIHQLVYYGQTMAMRIPFFDVMPKRDRELNTYNLYGSLCTINDILVKNITVPKLEIGDVFLFKNVGAYSSTEGISLFLSRDLPKVLICSRDKKISVVRDRIKTSELNFPNYQ